jgi:hypothetical protein
MLLLLQARLVNTVLLRRLRSPMPQLGHVLGLYPETAGRSSQKDLLSKTRRDASASSARDRTMPLKFALQKLGAGARWEPLELQAIGFPRPRSRPVSSIGLRSRLAFLIVRQ